MERSDQGWPELDHAYRLVSQIAQVLDNAEDGTAQQVERRFEAVLQRMEREANRSGSPQDALRHFLKVTASYRSHLFHTYRLADLPRTNNDLEQFFGSARYHERRIAGRKVASPSTVIRGQVRLVAAFGTRLHPPTGPELWPRCLTAWRRLRAGLEVRHEARRQQLRFRRSPDHYLAALEARLLKPTLPS